MTEGYFEAKKHAYRQTQDGIVISFVIHPNDVDKDFATAPLGTRYMVGFAEIGDDEQLVTPAKESRQWTDLDRCTQACILCNDPRFWDWANTTKDHARNVILSEFNITSRKELNQPRFEDHWNAYVDSYRYDMGLQAEDRS